MTFALRYIVLQSILLAGIAAAFIAGLAQKPFAGQSAYLCIIVMAVFMLGLGAVALKKWDKAAWIATHVLRLGLLGTVIGLLIAFDAASHIAPDPEASRAMISSTIGGMFVALWVTAFGIASNLWIRLNLLLLGNVHE